MDSLVPIPVAIPLIAAAVLPVLALITDSRRPLDVVSMAAAGTATAACMALVLRAGRGTLVYWFGGWDPRGGFPLGISFVVDPAGAGCAAMAGLLTTLAFVFAWRTFKVFGAFFHSLMLLFLGSMTGFCLTGDLFNLFVFLEMMGVAAYALTGYRSEDTGPLEGALNFAMMNSVGALAVLAGIALVYGRTGALNMARAGATLAASPADPLVLTAFGLILAGFFVKAALVPFHFWLPDAHAVAPTSASVLFSGIMVALGIFGAARVYWTVFSAPLAAHAGPLRLLLAAAGAGTAVLGAVMCFSQRHLKRLLAFSTVSHMGIVAAGVGLLDRTALAGAAVYMAGHGFVKAALFFCAGIVLHRKGGVDEEQLWGRCGELRAAGILFLTGGAALAGLPPFGLFLGKAMIGETAARLGLGWLEAAAIVSAALTGGAVLRAGAGLFLGWGRPEILPSTAPSRGDEEKRETAGATGRTPSMMWGPPALLATLCLLTGVLPGLTAAAARGAARFMDAFAYAAAVLEGAGPAPMEAAGAFSPGVRAVALGFLSAALAAAVAAAAVWSHRLPRRSVRLAGAVVDPVIGLLRRVHSGYAGDYVLWFTVGTSVLTALLAAMAVAR